jgi:hypothetical protein
MSPAIISLAEKLATGRGRYLSDQQLGAHRHKAGLSFDDARRAAVLADRIRRQKQAEERRNDFHVVPVSLDAPISLMDRKDRRRGAG